VCLGRHRTILGFSPNVLVRQVGTSLDGRSSIILPQVSEMCINIPCYHITEHIP
jgi:hypothetical protein